VNILRGGAEKFGKYAKWHSDKTAKTGFVGFDITTWEVLGIFGGSAAVYNLLNLGRHLTKAKYYLKLREAAFGRWAVAVA
jgi:hypothetical protein